MSARMTRSAGLLPLLALLFTVCPVSAADPEGVSPSWQRDPFRYVSPASRGPVDRLAAADKPVEKVEAVPRRPEAAGRGLEGIFVNNGIYRALYNGRLVGRGERFDGLLFRDITLYNVVVEDSSGRRTIELFHEN